MKKNKITLSEYLIFVRSLMTKFDDPEKELLIWGLGLTDEAGDVAACIKKTVAHKNDFTEGIKENLGDTMWYIGALCNYHGWDLEEILQLNVNKLSKRYKSGKFTYEEAQRKGEMVDWNEGTEVC